MIKIMDIWDIFGKDMQVMLHIIIVMIIMKTED